MFTIRSVIILTVLFLSYLLSTVSGSHHHHKCPSGKDWYYFNGWCYSLSEDTEGWFGSEKACQKLGGQLASINNDEENTFLRALGQCNQNFWIGLVKTDVNRRIFSWWNDVPFNYTTPLSINSNSYCDCVYLSGTNSARWYNSPCQNQYRRVCMVPPRDAELDNYNANNLQTVQSVAKDEWRKCPEGWLAIEGECFYVSSKPTNYFNAQISCEAMGATVASVKTQREQVRLTIALGCNARAWIGLEKVKPCIPDSSKSFCWMWMDGTEDDSYSAWASGHPSSSREIECAYTQGQWYTTNCYNENNFVCRKK